MRALSCVVLLSASISAQTQWIIDANNGPGTNFVSLVDALAAPQVTDGDLLITRAGTYDPFATSKGVAILGEGQVTISVASPSSAAAAVRVEGLSANKSFTMVDVDVRHSCTDARTALLLLRNDGRIQLENVSTFAVGVPTWLQPFCPAVVVDDCAHVSWNRGASVGGGGISVRGSTVALSAVIADGLDGQDLFIRRINSTPALDVRSNSLVILAEVDLTGGSAAGAVLPQPALRADDSQVRLAGTAANRLAAGLGAQPTPGVALYDAALVYDPAITIVATGGAPAIAQHGSATATARPLALVSGAGAPLGGTLQVGIRSAPGDAVFLALAAPTHAVQVPPLGILFLDLPTVVPIFVGTQGASGLTTRSIGVPNRVQLRGAVVALQAANFDVANSFLEFTNPVLVAIR